MKTAWVGIILLVVLVAACARTEVSPPTQPQQEAPKPVVQTPPPAPVKPVVEGVPDCGADAECFLNYLKECKPVKGLYESKTVTRFFEIKGEKEKFYCNTHLTTAGLNIVEEDCVARSDQQLYGELGYFKEQRSLAYFQVEQCTNRVVKS